MLLVGLSNINPFTRGEVREVGRDEFVWCDNWVRLQTNGAVKIDSRYAAVGGVLRHERGEWLFGFNRLLEKCSIFYAEFWGILYGLSLLQGKQCERVLIQTNSLEVFESF